MREKVYYSTHADLMACSVRLSLSKKYSLTMPSGGYGYECSNGRWHGAPIRGRRIRYRNMDAY